MNFASRRLRQAASWAVSVLFALTPAAVFAQTSTQLYWQCVAPSATNTAGGFCPAQQAYPQPVQNQAQSSQTITKSDSTVYSPALRGLWVGDSSACNLALVLADDTVPVTWPLPANEGFMPVSVKQVMSTNTTCATVIGLGYK